MGTPPSDKRCTRRANETAAIRVGIAMQQIEGAMCMPLAHKNKNAAKALRALQVWHQELIELNGG